MQQDYAKPAAPVYVVNGAAGNRESQEQPATAPWSVFESGEVGYALITITGPRLDFAFFAANGTLLDTFAITK